eukprot:1629375-Prymnesium_polylepis.2
MFNKEKQPEIVAIESGAQVRSRCALTAVRRREDPVSPQGDQPRPGKRCCRTATNDARTNPS